MVEVNERAIKNRNQTKIFTTPSYYETPTNILWRFSPERPSEEEEEEPDLSLGLSLGGLYAKSSKEKPLHLTRSSSVAGVASQDERVAAAAEPSSGWRESSSFSSFLSLSRSCSLPAETNEQATIKLRDLQSMRRMAAKKRLAQKQRTSFSFREAALEEEKTSEMAAWAAKSAAHNAALGRAISKIKYQGYVSSNYRQLEGHEFSTAARENGSSNSSIEPSEAADPPAMASAAAAAATIDLSDEPNPPLKKVKTSSNGKKVLDNWVDVMNRMPSVTTTGDGPNGKRIEGFLYKYTKGQVSIVCVCHGSFLSPAEFVRHAGGKEVANPMRHINVCTTFHL